MDLYPDDSLISTDGESADPVNVLCSSMATMEVDDDTSCFTAAEQLSASSFLTEVDTSAGQQSANALSVEASADMVAEDEWENEQLEEFHHGKHQELRNSGAEHDYHNIEQAEVSQEPVIECLYDQAEQERKLAIWMKKTPEQRLEMIWQSIDKVHDEYYDRPDYPREAFRYPRGTRVIVLSRQLQLYVQAEVIRGCRTMYFSGSKRKHIAKCIVKHSRKKTEEVVEWDLWELEDWPTDLHQQLLYAHYWNAHNFNKKKLTKSQRNWLFVLSDSELLALEEEWTVTTQVNMKHEMAFSQFVGVGPMQEKPEV